MRLKTGPIYSLKLEYQDYYSSFEYFPRILSYCCPNISDDPLFTASIEVLEKLNCLKGSTTIF